MQFETNQKNKIPKSLKKEIEKERSLHNNNNNNNTAVEYSLWGRQLYSEGRGQTRGVQRMWNMGGEPALCWWLRLDKGLAPVVIGCT